MKESLIKNFQDLAVTPERKDVLSILEAGLRSIDTIKIVKESVRLEGGHLCIKDKICSLYEVKRVYVVGVGKCVVKAAEALEEILGDRIEAGIVLDVSIPENCQLKKVKCFDGTHPFPSEKNVSITKQIVELLHGLTEEDLVIAIISGGGSTLLCLPDEGYSCTDEELILKELFKRGASIDEINTLRRHMSLARGGHLARWAYPAQMLSLIFSDVPGDDLKVIASGPTIKSETTIEDADRILSKYNILQACDLDHCGLVETPKDDKYFKKVINILMVSNGAALEAMAEKAGQLGYEAEVITDKMTGEASQVGSELAQKLNESPHGKVLLMGGETTVTVSGSTGQGGRNQELALVALKKIGEQGVIMAFASDGHDNSEYAGAVVDHLIKKESEKLSLDWDSYLAGHDSTSFFEKTGGLLKTGPTGLNVSDLVIALKK